jgi:integrase
MTTLNQETVAGLKLDDGERDRIYRDDDLHGFGIRVRYDSNNKLCKTWCIQYRIDGKQRRQNIGKFPRVNAAAARTKAGAWLDKVEEGTDPAVTRENDRKAEALKFHHAVGMYLAKQETKVRRSTFDNTKLYLTGRRYLEPLHKKPVAKVTQSDVEQCLDAIPKKPTRWAVQRCLSAFYVWAVRKGHASGNPLVKIEQIKLESRQRVLKDHELAVVWNALQDDDLGRIIKLLLLSGWRANEIGGLRWDEVDLDTGLLTLPPERCKNGRAHTLTLPPLAVEIIRSVKRRDGRDFVFGKWAGGFTWWAKQKNLVQPLGLEHWTIHDLRRTVATGMCEIGTEPHVVEAVLNHVSGHKAGVAGIYNRASYKEPMRAALARWADHLQSVVTGGKVVPLRKAVPLRA